MRNAQKKQKYKVFHNKNLYFHLISLGCAKNLVESEIVMGELLAENWIFSPDPRHADLIVVNTCGFIEDAREESFAVLAECLEMKKDQPGLKVVAVGCLPQRISGKILERLPALDAVWGTGVYGELDRMCRALVEGTECGQPPLRRTEDAGVYDGPRLITTGPAFAYLRLSDGCDNNCAYCAIPAIRGGFRSRPLESILAEAQSLVDGGASELVLIGQDTTRYGMDLSTSLSSLLEQLLARVSVPRIRLLYAHPAHLDDSVIALLLAEPRLCGYLDVPIQHISDRILKGMNRGYGRERVEQLTSLLAGRPDLTLRTTVLAGFPGESERDFEELLSFTQSGHFHHLGAFAYSSEMGTAAAEYPGQVPSEEAARRRDAIMLAQQKVAFAWLDGRVGGVEHVLLDRMEEGGVFSGRTVREAPDADGVVWIEGKGLKAGDMVKACVFARDGYDLLAREAD